MSERKGLPEERLELQVRADPRPADDTDRTKAESALRLHSIVAANMAEGLCLVRIVDETIVQTNPRFDRMLGYEPGELLGRPLAAIRSEMTRRRVEARGEDEGGAERERRGRSGGAARQEGRHVLWCRAHVSRLDHAELGPVWVVLHEDITDLKQLYARLVLSDRMASLGR